MELIFKNATINDIDIIFDLEKKLITDYEVNINLDFHKVFNWIRKKIESNITNYKCIFLDNIKVGYFFLHDEEDKLELDDFFIFEEFQSKGIGAMVLEHVFSICKEKNKDIFLYVFTKNYRAIGFYKRHGFKVVENIRDSRYVMLKQLMIESSKVQLRIPEFHELSFRKKLLSDKETMTYNIGFGESEGTGCISFEESSWKNWYSRWVNNMPDKYYAYVINVDENTPIGEVALRYDSEKKAYCVSIIIEAKYRGNGFSEQALELLSDVAFNQLGAEKIFDDFPSSRISAEKVFKKVGFKRVSDAIVELTKHDYLRKLDSLI